jgi:hypothetical protein
MPSPVRAKFGKTNFNQAVKLIRDKTDLITVYVGKMNVVIMAALDIADHKKNIPFMPPLIVHLSHLSARLTEIQKSAAEIRSAVEEIAEITYQHLKELDNGD